MAILLSICLLIAIPHSCDLLLGNAPMTVYGQVIDQTGAPVPAAAVDFESSAVPRSQIFVPWTSLGESAWHTRTTTAADGSFSVFGGRGKRMNLAFIEKSGYSEGIVPGPFRFEHGGLYADHTDIANRAIFVWWNDNFKRILSRDVICRPGQHIYALEYLRGRVSTNMGVLEHIEFSVIRPSGNPPRPYSWGIKIRAPRGGIQEAVGALKPDAPPDGYMPDFSYIVQADSPSWSPQVVKHFYSRARLFPLGVETYAAITFTVTLGANGDDPTVTIHYTVNFGNSRDLTPGPIKPAEK
jgi:hypothetical protein